MNESEHSPEELKELRKQYAPSKWCRRMSPDHVVGEHVKIVRKASEEAKLQLQCQTNVPYGPTPGQKMDILRNEQTAPDSPIFVFIHGGYWQEMSKEDYVYLALPIVQVGGIVINVEHDLAPKVNLSEIILQISKAFDHILSLAMKSKSRGVYLGGHCAGAHLALMALMINSTTPIHEVSQKLVKGFVLISGVYDVRPVIYTCENDALLLTKDEAWSASPSNPENLAVFCNHYMHSPVLIVIGEYDSPEFHKQSKHFQSLLMERDISTKFIEIPSVDHFDVVEKMQSSSYSLTKEIIELMDLV